MGETVSLLWTSSFTATEPTILLLPKGRITFTVKEKDLKLVSNMPDSNRNWKSRYFFVEGTDWVCRQEEWVTMPRGYFDNMWAFFRESG